MKKKILFFTNGLYGGGAEQILLTLLTHIDYTLFNITLYSLTKDDVTKEYPEQIHYNYIFHPISDQDNCSGMNELLQGEKYGIITENSEATLFEGIKQLLDHPEQLSHYKEKVIKRGKEFTLEVLMKPIETLLTR